jgi:winged helix-turn helix protein
MDTELGAAHLLTEMMVARFDGGAHQPQNGETTMLNTAGKIIKHKTGLLNLAGEPGNVSKACQVMHCPAGDACIAGRGSSRDTFYRYKSAVEEGGVEALFERTRRKPNLANRVDEAIEQAVVKSATDFPAYGQVRISNGWRKPGVFASPSGVRSIWLRQDLANHCPAGHCPAMSREGSKPG